MTLSASGLPYGVSAQFSPNPATDSSILTLMASSTAAPGAATVTITGEGGGMIRTVTLSLVVEAQAEPGEAKWLILTKPWVLLDLNREVSQ